MKSQRSTKSSATWLIEIPQIKLRHVREDQLGDFLVYRSLPCARTVVQEAVTRTVWDDDSVSDSPSSAFSTDGLFYEDEEHEQSSKTKQVTIAQALYNYIYPEIFKKLFNLPSSRVHGNTIAAILSWAVQQFEPLEFDSLYRLYDGEDFLHYLIELQASSTDKG